MLVVAVYLLEAKADRQLGSAGNKELETVGYRLLGSREKINKGPGILLLVAFIKRKQQGTGLTLIQQFQKKLLKLLHLRLVNNSQVVLNYALKVQGQFQQLDNKLSKDYGKEHSSSTTIAFAFLKEEANARHLGFRKLFSHSTRDSRLASTSYAIQLEDIFSIRILDLYIDLGEKVNIGVKVAARVILVLIGVEYNTFSN